LRWPTTSKITWIKVVKATAKIANFKKSDCHYSDEVRGIKSLASLRCSTGILTSNTYSWITPYLDTRVSFLLNLAIV
jgi:hypothetical protein